MAQPADALDDFPQVRGHDIAFLPGACDGAGQGCGALFIADLSGDQAYLLRYAPQAGAAPVGAAGSAEPVPDLLIERRYYPLRHFTGTALVSDWDAGEVFYHQGARWLPIKPLPRTKFEEEATLVLPATPAPGAAVPGPGAPDAGFDGRDPGCVWHRLCIDACIPPETGVRVAARAADTVSDLALEPWLEQPVPYLRPTGSEIPYSSFWNDRERRSAHTGTWELLFQGVQGRYLQVRLTLTGDGRSSPALRALRIHYPRFSYLNAYLPAVYRQEPTSAAFLEAFLANPEGILTTIEGLIAQVQTLMDVRSVPDDAVDWLASWLGLAFAPSWTDAQRRLLIAQAPYFFLRRGTLPVLLQAILLAIHPELGPAIFRDDVACPTVRIVERFLTRTLPGVAAGDPTEPDVAITGNAQEDAAARAHAFVVLVPTLLDAETRGLVERVIELEKPAHASFVIKEYWAQFRVGEIRLGIDTAMGQGGRFELFRLGQTALAEGLLGAAFPHNLTVRTVLEH
jgi:phage tail-like protein